jgi:lipopolysaccharide export LptBFGC system permease protein LptF
VNQVEEVVQKEPQAKNRGTVYAILGWIFCVLSLAFVPILFGALAFIMGFLLRRSGKDVHGVVLMVMAVAGAILGVIIGIIIGTARGLGIM